MSQEKGKGLGSRVVGAELRVGLMLHGGFGLGENNNMVLGGLGPSESEKANHSLSVSFSADNRQIVSASRDRTIKLWNTLGECKFNITEDAHTEWYVVYLKRALSVG